MWATRVAILLASHAGVAFYHHFVKKDNVLNSMVELDLRQLESGKKYVDSISEITSPDGNEALRWDRKKWVIIMRRN